MPQIRTVLSLIQTAALNPDMWPKALQLLGRKLRVESASLAEQDRLTHQLHGDGTGLHVEVLKAYGDYCCRIHPVSPPTFAARAGTALIDRKAVELYASERT